MQADRPSGLRT